MMAWLPSLESFNYILIVFNTAQLYLLPTTVCSISPLSAVDCCLTFNQNKNPPVLCLQSQNQAELYLLPQTSD